MLVKIYNVEYPQNLFITPWKLKKKKELERAGVGGIRKFGMD